MQRDNRFTAVPVFRPRAGTRPCDVHVRISGNSNERYVLLFRDFSAADSGRDVWVGTLLGADDKQLPVVSPQELFTRAVRGSPVRRRSRVGRRR